MRVMTKIVFSGFARTLKGSACAKKSKNVRENIRLGQTGFDLWAQKPASLYVPKWVKNDKIEKKPFLSKMAIHGGKTGSVCLT